MIGISPQPRSGAARALAMFCVLLVACMAGCSTPSRVDHIPLDDPNEDPSPGRDLVIFLDGTANDEGSYTNIARLHNLVTLQDKTNIRTTYIRGVGTGKFLRVTGMAAGAGIGKDVREAYDFLLENYESENDRIVIFGFSRGAYAGRILSSLLYFSGLPEVKHLSDDERAELVTHVYKSFKGYAKDSATRRARVTKTMERLKVEGAAKPAVVDFLGLWDTVEALGFPNYKEDINEPNIYYADQFCNIRDAAHALSIDDNRARIFTPLLLSRRHLTENSSHTSHHENHCDEKVDKKRCDVAALTEAGKMEEVWFSGAHSDVGGGYADTEISGISLNWMLDKIDNAGLSIVPDGARVYANYLDKTHDPEGGFWGLIYRHQSRDLANYTHYDPTNCPTENRYLWEVDFACTSTQASQILRVHQSALDRLCHKSPNAKESHWFRDEKYQNCLSCDEDGQGRIGDGSGSERDLECRNRIVAVNNSRYSFRAPDKRDKYCDFSFCPSLQTTEYADTKSCNYTHPLVAPRATSRLKTVRMDDLGKGVEQEVIFFSDINNDHTGVYLTAGKTYVFRKKDVQNWVDCSITDSTPEYGRDTFASESLRTDIAVGLAKPFTYYPSAGYQELLGEVAGNQFRLGQVLAGDGKYQPSKSGELVLRVNEPACSEGPYENNAGVIVLGISEE